MRQLHTVGDSDDVFYDRKRWRIYALGGQGAAAAYAQLDADYYRELPVTPTRTGARTGFFSPKLNGLYVAARKQADHPAAVVGFTFGSEGSGRH
ncbi:MAG: hypothetical protein NVS9B15_14080 [Acidobacteriaceae bacterium]